MAAASAEAIDLLGKELLGDVIPLIEKTYRVTANRANRAITGLSMGGGQAFTIGLKHMETFAWVGEFSSGLLSDAGFNLARHLPGFLDDPARMNQQLKLLFLSCGTEDPRIPGHLDLADALKGRQIHYVWYPTPGAHEWKVWRHSLAEFLPKLFRKRFRISRGPPDHLSIADTLHRIFLFAPRGGLCHTGRDVGSHFTHGSPREDFA